MKDGHEMKGPHCRPEWLGLPGQAEMLNTLHAILDRWVVSTLAHRAAERRWLGHADDSLEERFAEADVTLTNRMAEEARPHLAALLRDNSDRSAEQLEKIAAHLSPGGAHTGAELIRTIQAGRAWTLDLLLMAAIYRYNWHGGKAGFQFLPDPATVDLDDYRAAVWDLLEVFDQAADGDPRRILTGEDLAFFDSLPHSFTIYRGARGISPEKIAAGVCWTTKREVAEWFALRGDEPVLMTARCKKAYVRLAKASEFEIVTVPERARVIACRPRGRSWRPEMSWAP